MNIGLSETSNNLNSFLFKYFLSNILINFFFYLYPNVLLPLIIYTLLFFFSLIYISKIYKNYIFCFFAHILALFLINLTYLNFILSVIINHLFSDQDFNSLMLFNFYCDLKSYFLANIYLTIFSFLIVVFFNLFIKFDFIESTINKIEFDNLKISKKKNFFLICVCLIIESIYLFSGTLGSQVSGSFILDDKNDSATWFTHFYYFIVTFHLLLNLLFLKNKSNNFSSKTFILFSFIANFIFYGFFMRRMAVQFIFIAIIIYFMLSEIKIKKIKFFIINVILISILFQFTNFLQLIRTSEMYSVQENQNLKEIILEGRIFEYFTNQDMRNEAQEISMKNFSKRLFSNHELATIFYFEKNTEKKFLNGQLIINNIIRTIPQVIFPGKINYLSSDLLISSITDSPLYRTDTIDSLHSYSYIDFNLMGLIIYPLMITLMFYFFYRIINSKFINSFSALFIIMLFLPMYTLRVAEINLNDWFVLIRNIIIFILVFNSILTISDNKIPR